MPPQHLGNLVRMDRLLPEPLFFSFCDPWKPLSFLFLCKNSPLLLCLFSPVVV
ncbi:hypothetical protein L249_0827 [Ophiocordyceps polyrhachis-furcata BCC 54312]|uniref:Uncharacterized protein n=1 Tax=Ophiocordyceps polyrhachis-furcata BCC 54312 TaxID=1330021 RepID=A0A367LFM6_9HYPO|nr:hypothetical protein L249_0827 [Ophiocordyceps polyrhachis-furcata BCC 54312]